MAAGTRVAPKGFRIAAAILNSTAMAAVIAGAVIVFAKPELMWLSIVLVAAAVVLVVLGTVVWIVGRVAFGRVLGRG